MPLQGKLKNCYKTKCNVICNSAPPFFVVACGGKCLNGLECKILSSNKSLIYNKVQMNLKTTMLSVRGQI